MTSANEQNIVIDENIPGRNLAMGIFSLPMLIAISTVVGIPFLAFNMFTIVVAVITTVISELFVIWVALKYTKNLTNWRDYLKIQKFTGKTFALGLGAGLVMFLALQGVSYLLNNNGFELNSSDTSTTLSANTSVFTHIIIYFICVPFIIPFVEEIFFRGMIMSAFTTAIKNPKTGKILAVVVSSIAFGLAHLQGFSTFTDLFIVIWTAIIAVISSLSVLKFNSIWPAFALHLTYNGITVLLTTLGF